MIRRLLKRLRADRRGSYVIEFALVTPILLVAMFGMLDMAYRLYAKSILEGAVLKAARDSTLELGSTAANNTLVDNIVKNTFKDVNGKVVDADYTFTRRNFADFSNAGKMEPATGPGGQCAPPVGATVYTYVDVNNSGSWDDGAIAGQGGANDAVLYTVTVRHQSLSPVNSLFGAEKFQTIRASTVLRNQPYNNQAARTTGPTRNCT